MKCKICNEEVKNARHFSSKHGLSQKDYFLRYHPKFDLYDGSPIEFKDKNQYLAAEFNSKVNMSAWLRKASDKEAKELILKLFKNRIAKKKLKFAPCAVELKTCNELPSLMVIKKNFCSYNDIIKKLPLYNRFYEEELPPVNKDKIKIAIDTREQKAIDFSNSIKTKLNFGDYTIIGDGFANIFIERKGEGDFLSTIGQGFDRFCREISRAKHSDAYIVVIVEKPLSYMTQFDKTYLSKFTKASPKYIFGNMNQILQKFDNIQFLFVDKKETGHYIEKILRLGSIVRFIDLQQTYEEGRL